MTLFELAAVGVLAATVAGLVVLVWRRGGLVHDPDAVDALQGQLRRLAESEERYRTLVEATTQLIEQRDAQGRLTFTNEGFATLLGASPLDLIGSEARPRVTERRLGSEGPGGSRQVEERIVSAEGTARWYSFVEMPVEGTGAPQRLRAGCDITARVEATRALDEARSRAEAANVAKSRFLATVSHEFRTPLNGILGMADLVLATPLDPEQRTYVDAVRTSGRALLNLVDGILDFSRIEAGRLDLVAEPFDAAAVTEGVVELLAPRAQDKGLEIALDVADGLGTLHVGDADRVRQILLNLGGNAVKFTAEGGVGLSLSAAGEGIALCVEDTGPGIPEDRLPILFEEFEQGEDPAGRQEGTGLGLAITRRLVEQMGGCLTVTPRADRGTLFRVELPLPTAATASPPAAPLPDLGGQRVLIVAASPFQAPFLARCLARAGVSARVAESGEAGRAALAETAFDTVIADRGLGDGTVRDLAAEARRRGVRRCLILLSPFDRREFGAPAAAGFDGYLIKPVRARSLLARLRGVPAGPGGAAPVLPAVAPPLPAPGEGPRVLLAEDNAINALLASKALERLGARVTLARDGLETLARIAEAGEPFDLALIDLRMPGLDGLATARLIRAREAETGHARLRLVALTANTGHEDRQAAQAAGFDDFLPKPLDLRALPGLLARRADRAA